MPISNSVFVLSNLTAVLFWGRLIVMFIHESIHSGTLYIPFLSLLGAVFFNSFVIDVCSIFLAFHSYIPRTRERGKASQRQTVQTNRTGWPKSQALFTRIYYFPSFSFVRL